MGWDAVIVGDLAFEPGARWRERAAQVADLGWPPMFAPSRDTRHGSIDDVLALLARRPSGSGHHYLLLDVTEEALRLRAVVGEDEYRELVDALGALLSSAVEHGARGRFQARDLGTQRGVSFELGDGKLTMSAVGLPKAVDRAALTEALQRAFARPRIVDAKTQREADARRAAREKARERRAAKKAATSAPKRAAAKTSLAKKAAAKKAAAKTTPAPKKAAAKKTAAKTRTAKKTTKRR
ncbi:MAG: hypothetical protein U0234_22530 [Sandaracinus sp.]